MIVSGSLVAMSSKQASTSIGLFVSIDSTRDFLNKIFALDDGESHSLGTLSNLTVVWLFLEIVTLSVSSSPLETLPYYPQAGVEQTRDES